MLLRCRDGCNSWLFVTCREPRIHPCDVVLDCHIKTRNLLCLCAALNVKPTASSQSQSKEPGIFLEKLAKMLAASVDTYLYKTKRSAARIIHASAARIVMRTKLKMRKEVA